MRSNARSVNENGNLSSWTSGGAAASISWSPHSGGYAAQLGATSATNGDSSLSQTFTIPQSASTLSFWYQVHCPDTLTYDWATATLRDNSNNSIVTLLPKTCTNNGSWVNVSAPVGASAGHSVTLALSSHDDNAGGDPTFTWYDDISVF